MKASKCRLPTAFALGASLLMALCAPSAWAACDECATVTSVKTVKIEGEGSGVGAVAGGVVGGLLGNQLGGGRGRDVATVGGLVGGAYVGHQVEKKSKEKMQYRVVVKMENGESKTFKYAEPTSYKVGDKVKVKGGSLVRQ